MTQKNNLQLKMAVSMKTGRKALLPPTIYNNPIRMQTGGWMIIDKPNENENPLFNNSTASQEIIETFERPSALELALGTNEIIVDDINEVENSVSKKRGRKSKLNSND